MAVFEGYLRKMATRLDPDTRMAIYTLMLDDKGKVVLNSFVGKYLKIQFLDNIQCVSCGRKIKKTYQDGYCFPCMSSKAECDICIVKPHLCHFHLGTCRNEAWGTKHCFQEHTLYLVRTNKIKIGITRTQNKLHRWMDQGAAQAKEIGRFSDRRSVGLVEEKISKIMSDRTDWRKMLKNEMTDEDFSSYFEKIKEILSSVEKTHLIHDETPVTIHYPVKRYPEKVTSLKLNKSPSIEGTLTGIRGQYLMFGTDVFNVRAHSGYHVKVEISS